MVRKRTDRQWFSSDYFVWGWYPASWQGWVVLCLSLLILLYGSWVLLPHGRLQAFDEDVILTWLLFVAVVIGSLVLIVWRAGGRPKRGERVGDGEDRKK